MYSGDLRKKRSSCLSNAAFAWRAASFSVSFPQIIKEQIIQSNHWFCSLASVASLSYLHFVIWLLEDSGSVWLLHISQHFSSSNPFAKGQFHDVIKQQIEAVAYTPCCGPGSEYFLCAHMQPPRDMHRHRSTQFARHSPVTSFSTNNSSLQSPWFLLLQ